MHDDVDTDLSDLDISDDDLAALAMAADSDGSFEDDAVPMRSLAADDSTLLPDWYMPVVQRRASSDWRAGVAVAIAVGLVLANAFAICVTYGFPTMP
ncbi:MAG: hypothetical protein ABI706_16620 [Ilumatobacteraceae bacterium]